MKGRRLESVDPDGAISNHIDPDQVDLWQFRELVAWEFTGYFDD